MVSKHINKLIINNIVAKWIGAIADESKELFTKVKSGDEAIINNDKLTANLIIVKFLEKKQQED